MIRWMTVLTGWMNALIRWTSVLTEWMTVLTEWMTFDKMDQRVDNLEKTTKGELRAIKMYLENEIEPKISIVAEGHIDLMRKFRKIQVCKEEWEMMKMRVLALERGVREIKAKMDVA